MSWTSLSYSYWDHWEFYHKVVFDGPNKIIWITSGTTEIDVRRDLYSAWKEWVATNPDGLIDSKYLYAMRAVGGDPLPGSRFLGTTFFLSNGWRIKPYTGSYRLTVTGNLYTEEGDTPYLDADGYLNNIRIESTVSTLVEAIGLDSNDLSSAVWGTDPADYEDQDDTMGQEITNISSKTKLIPGLF